MKKQKKPVPPAEAEPVIKKQPLLKRLLFGPEKPDLSELEAGSTTILDILSPTAIDTKSRDYIVVDGVFHAYLYITGYGYSTTVGSCWLAPLVEAGEGVNVSFSFTRQNREKILSKIAQTTMLNRSRMRDVGDTRQDYEELDSAITSGLYLKDVMNRQGEDFYYMHTLIEVVADDPDIERRTPHGNKSKEKIYLPDKSNSTSRWNAKIHPRERPEGTGRKGIKGADHGQRRSGYLQRGDLRTFCPDVV